MFDLEAKVRAWFPIQNQRMAFTDAIQGLDFILSESMSDLIDCNDVMPVLGATQLSQK